MPDLPERLTELARLLVDQPDQVALAVIPPNRDNRDTLFELAVAPDDLGKVIGRQGRTARALRTLLDARSDRDGVRYELEILED